MVAKQRIQFNIQLLKTDKIDLFKDLSGDIVPVFWIDEVSIIRIIIKSVFSILLNKPDTRANLKNLVCLSSSVHFLISNIFYFDVFNNSTYYFKLLPANFTLSKK